jgi:hypothetical protein
MSSSTPPACRSPVGLRPEPAGHDDDEPTVVIADPDLLDEVTRLRQADGGDIVIWGTGQLTDALAKRSWSGGTVRSCPA